MPKRDSEGGNDDDRSALSDNGATVFSTQATLNFIDLAGSERASIHEASNKSSVPIGATVRN